MFRGCEKSRLKREKDKKENSPFMKEYRSLEKKKNSKWTSGRRKQNYWNVESSGKVITKSGPSPISKIL
jgi:hypothetical protein